MCLHQAFSARLDNALCAGNLFHDESTSGQRRTRELSLGEVFQVRWQRKYLAHRFPQLSQPRIQRRLVPKWVLVISQPKRFNRVCPEPLQAPKKFFSGDVIFLISRIAQPEHGVGHVRQRRRGQTPPQQKSPKALHVPRFVTLSCGGRDKHHAPLAR